MTREKRVLPIANRHNDGQLRAPTIKAINDGMEITKYSFEGAEYLEQTFKKRMVKLGKSMEESSKGMQRQLNEHTKFVAVKNNPAHKIWSGEPVKTGMENFQNFIVNNAAKEFTDKIQRPIKINFAVSDESHYIRGFKVEGEKLASEKLASELEQPLDQVINGFFAENGLMLKGSYLYETTDEGTIKQVNGINVKAEPIKTKEKIANGLAQYLEGKKISATVKGREYPAGKAEAQKEKVTTPEAVTPESPNAAPAA